MPPEKSLEEQLAELKLAIQQKDTEFNDLIASSKDRLSNIVKSEVEKVPSAVDRKIDEHLLSVQAGIEKKYKNKFIWIFGTATVFVIAGLFFYVKTEMNRELIDFQEKILDKQTAVMEADSRIRDLNTRIDDAQKDLDDKLNKLDTAIFNLSSTNKKLSEAEKKYNDLVNKLSTIKH